MMELTITWRFVVGIDISKQVLDCSLLDRKTSQQSELQVPNTSNGFSQLGQWLLGQQIVRSQTILVSEHTGRYGELLLRWTTTHNWHHAVVKTTALEKVAPEHHRKDDHFDAYKLSEYGARFGDRLRLRKAPKPAVGQIKRLQAERRKMVDRRAALKSKLSEGDTHDADMSQLTEMWPQQVDLLSQHIDQLEDTMDQLIDQNSGLAIRHQTMQTAPGIGSWTVLAESVCRSVTLEPSKNLFPIWVCSSRAKLWKFCSQPGPIYRPWAFKDAKTNASGSPKCGHS